MVPSGPAVDMAEVSAGRFVYDPAKINVPTLIIFGEWDAIATEEGGKRLFDLLTGTQRKSRVIIGRGTHLPQFESVRFELYRNISTFLEIDDPDMVDSARY
jgi:pimeloyl-ACP methyl ester carboxylesterase